ncbi:acetyl/propionyl-CoA carboxylase subunit alpha [Zafaria cholistanensis]|uniref:biotin carboxylase n=1 Tax=Zafaria cholistanensis TaxID=1682741 RepID=A0A5A7NNW5_9MICC|nr:biotin carboxylase N-terminal domain-containing protein [Zafaria cholistanensis]GER22555.1 acetyl/propionyl-CoA carboxylase subunit alpha [Zafaria cholistanensis]
MPAPPFDTVLVANRGEIACRIIRTLRALGIRSAAVYTEPDAGARHVREADLALSLGPAPGGYLEIEAVVEACRRAGAQAVHPGYGFLSENAAFGQALAAAGIVFIGPDAQALEVMGDKIRARHQVAAHGVPVVPGAGEPGMTDEELMAVAGTVGYPLLVKPSAGGGGKGMVAVATPRELPEALAAARRTARGAFGDDTLLLERLISSPRHLEVQVLADRHGTTLHLGERECSLQRRHQKVVEEAPSPLLESLPDGSLIRDRLGAAAVAAARSVGYVGAGTVEFLVSADAPGEFFFMEMNTRLQVEHPVTEETVWLGDEPLDLVAWQVRIAAGEPLEVPQSDVEQVGHAVEARVYAEDPSNGFLPSPGIAYGVREPFGEGVRVDSLLEETTPVPEHYDPMLAKIVAWGEDRETALRRLDEALAQTVVLGVHTNLEHLRFLVTDADVRAGRLDTGLIERRGTQPGRWVTEEQLAAIAARYLEAEDAGGQPPGYLHDGGGNGTGGHGGSWDLRDGWRLGTPRPRLLTLETRDGSRDVAVLGTPGAAGTDYVLEIDGTVHRVAPAEAYDSDTATVNGRRFPLSIGLRQDAWLPATAGGRGTPGAEPPPGYGEAWVSAEGWSAKVHRPTRRELLERRLADPGKAGGGAPAGPGPEVRSPMPGTVVAVPVSNGDRVEAGQLLVAVEAMKMEHRLTAAVAGTVTVLAAVGDPVRRDQLLAVVHPPAELPQEGG